MNWQGVARGLAVVGAAVAAAAGCTVDAPGGAQVAVSVAPLTLPGITDARFTLSVTNGLGQTVMTRTLDSVGYGAGDGSVSYVASCDAQSNPNTVTLTLLGVYTGAGGAALLDPATYRNPGPMPRTVVCAENADVALTWDITLARAATQGFFDVAVAFEDIFCSAKVDCVDAEGDPLALLFNASGARDRTVVLGLACTADLGAGDTVLYRDDVVVDCGAAGVATVDPSAGPGNLGAGAGLTDPTGRLFAAAVYRGAEQLGFNKVYWNVLLGLGPQTTACRLTTRATASDAPFPGGLTPAGTTWPLIEVDVPLTSAAGALVCGRHPIDSATSPGVATVYTAIDGPEAMAYGFAPEGLIVDPDPEPEPPPDATVSGAAQVVNAYATLTADVAAGATTLPVDADVVAVGDRVLVLQVQGPGASAGTWEVATVAGASAGTIQLAAGLQNAYVSGLFDASGVNPLDPEDRSDEPFRTAEAAQVVRIARYGTLTVSGTITALPWDGHRGGVVAIEATSAVVFTGAGQVDVDGKGFRGAPRDHLRWRNGWCGEGVLGNPLIRCVDQNSVPASGTGGCGAVEGTSGSNDGVAAAGGGANEATPPADGHTYNGNSRQFARSGSAYRVGDFEALVFGGGGGQGDSGSNDWTTLAPGGAGGGAVWISAPSVVAPVVSADGLAGTDGADFYGSGGDWGVSGGGGGAGGTIRLAGAAVTGGALQALGGAGGQIFMSGYGVAAKSRSGGAGRVRVQAPYTGSSVPAAH